MNVINDTNEITKKKDLAAFPCPCNANVLMKPHLSRDSTRNQYRLILSLDDKNISKTTICHYGKSRRQLETDAKSIYAIELYNRLTPEDKCHFKTMKDLPLGITLRTILDTHSDRLRSLVAGKSDIKYEILQELCSALSQKSVGEVLLSDCYDAIACYIETSTFETQAEKDKLNNTCVELLKAMFEFCLSSGFCNRNPSKHLAKEVKQQGIMKKHMHAKSFLESEENRLYEHLASQCEADPKSFGALLSLLQGVTPQEVCGCRFDDILQINTGRYEPQKNLDTLFSNGPYALKVSRVYRCIDGRWLLTDLVEERTVYRVIPLSDICMKHIRNRLSYILKNYGPFDNVDKLPLVGESGNSLDSIKKHCRPDYLGKYVRNLLRDLDIKQATLFAPSPVKESDKFQKINMDAGVRRLRQHFENRLLYVCGMERGEVNYLLGRKAQDVDSRHYIDFLERLIQHKLKQKLDRWKTELVQNRALEGEILPNKGLVPLSIQSEWSGTIRPNTNKEYAAFSMELTAPLGQPLVIDLRCLKAFNGTITIQEVPNENQE